MNIRFFLQIGHLRTCVHINVFSSCYFSTLIFTSFKYLYTEVRSFLECWSSSIPKRVRRFSFGMIRFIGINFEENAMEPLKNTYESRHTKENLGTLFIRLLFQNDGIRPPLNVFFLLLIKHLIFIYVLTFICSLYTLLCNILYT